MLAMFQRPLGAPCNGLARQASSELTASPCAISRCSSPNNSFVRRAPAGGPNSRSRTSLLITCSGPIGPLGDDSASGSSPQSEVQSQSFGEPRAQQQHPAQPGSRSLNSRSLNGPDAAAPRPPSPSPLSPPTRSQNDSTWDFSVEPIVPSPANLPTNDDAVLYPPRSLPSLHKGDFWTLTAQPGLDLFRAGPKVWDRLPKVFAILFGVGQRATQGIYSLRAFGVDGTPHETILAFECEEEAQRYAGLLEASMDHSPHVCSIPPRQLLGFCMDHSYACRLEPRGSLLIPPDFNVSVTDWERSMRLRNGKFAVLESEPELRSPEASGATSVAVAVAPPPPAAAAGPSGAPGGGGSRGRDPSKLARYWGLGGAALDDVRARLEALLPDDGATRFAD